MLEEGLEAAKLDAVIEEIFKGDALNAILDFDAEEEACK